MKKLHNNFILLLIILLGAILRVIFLSSSPPSLNIDEAALGYNAYSLFKTGADEHGRFLPLVLESFGDWKLPMYAYTAIIPIAVFNLTEFSVRLPSITSGIIGIVLIYSIARYFFKQKSIALFSALFFSLSPWSIYFSRAAYEVNLATTFFLFGLLIFLYAINNQKRRYFLLISAFFFGLTIFTYHSFIIFTPLFTILLAVYYKKILTGRYYLFAIIIFLVFCFLSAYVNFVSSSKKFTTTTVFTSKNVLYERVNNLRGDNSVENPLFKKIHTRYLGIPYHIGQNYLLSFSPSFLFDTGGEKLVHNLNGFGNLLLFDAILLVAGFIGICYMRERFGKFIFIWLILAPIPNALTLDSPNSTRLFILLPALIFIEAYGAYMIFKILKNGIRRLILITLIFLYILNFIFFLDSYFVHFAVQRAKFWHYGFKEIVQISNKYPDADIVMQGLYDFPYIYILFYNKYDPQLFRRDVVYYPTNNEGFRYVKSFGRYTFVHALSEVEEKDGVLYFDNQNFHYFDKIIRLPNGDEFYRYYFKHEKH